MTAPLANPQKRNRGIFYKVILATLLFHIALILLAGPVVIYSYFFRNETVFETAPEVQRTIEPRKLEYKVHLKKTQRRSGRPRVQPRLTADRLSELSLPDIKLDPAPVRDREIPRVADFASMGIGTGMGDGRGNEGVSLGDSSVNFFGVRARGERVFILVDVSSSMIEEIRGGFPGFKLVRSDLTRLINSLSPGSRFNVGAFASSYDQYKDNMIFASAENKRSAIDWLGRYNNPGGQLETRTPNTELAVELDSYKVGQGSKGGTTRQDLALSAAMAQGADAIFLITDGQPRLMRHLTEEEWDDWKAKYWTPAEMARVEKARAKEVKALEKENKKRARKGLPPKVDVEYGIAALRWPEMPRDTLLEYIEDLQRKLYTDQQKKKARIYVVGYETLPDDETYLRQVARKNGGTFRRLKNLIK